MKILQIHNYYKSRGGESFVLDAEKKMLEEKGHQVIRLTTDNIDLKKILFERKGFYRKLSDIVKEQQPDVAHIHNIYQIIGPEIYQFLSSKQIPVVQTLHNFRFLCPNGLFFDNNNEICERCKDGNFFNAVRKKCYQGSMIKSAIMAYQVKKARKAVIKYADSIICLNEFAKKKILDAGFDKEKVTVKPNFIFSSSINQKSCHKDFALYIGRVSKEKGIDNLINTFKTVKYPLVIAGTGNYLETAKTLAKGADNITFVGFISGEKKEDMLATCSFITFPSTWYEMFPISILEAYRYLKPVIASEIGGIPEIVKHQETGLVYDINNPQDLKEKIIWAMEHEDDIKIMGENGFKRLQEHYSAEANYNILMDIYNKVISTKKQ